jgi:hypothetical protein
MGLLVCAKVTTSAGSLSPVIKFMNEVSDTSGGKRPFPGAVMAVFEKQRQIDSHAGF